MRVLLDPGHGGPLQCGAMWPPFRAPDHGDAAVLAEAIREHESQALAVEKRINLEVAYAAKCLLDGAGLPIACSLTRELDEALTLSARADIGRKRSADLVISIHADTSHDPAVTGLWTYARRDDAPALVTARHLMTVCPPQIRRATVEPQIALPRPAWTGAAHAVLARYSVPAVLLECGFLSNDADRAFLTSTAGQMLVATAIVSAIIGAWRRQELAA